MAELAFEPENLVPDSMNKTIYSRVPEYVHIIFF